MQSTRPEIRMNDFLGIKKEARTIAPASLNIY